MEDGDRLGLDALSCIYKEQSTLAGGERARDFPSEVDVSLISSVSTPSLWLARETTHRCINQVEEVSISTILVDHASSFFSSVCTKGTKLPYVAV